MTAYGHTPVLLKEALNGLAIRKDGKYVDCTFGRGGHSRAILAGLGAGGRLLALDRDARAIELARERHGGDSRVAAMRACFSGLRAALAEQPGFGAGAVDGVLLDLGVSSAQLDDPERGFSFRLDGRLDMRMDTSAGFTARDWIRDAPAGEMTQVFRRYGEERFARAIAAAIVARRERTPIDTTVDLAALVESTLARVAPHPRPAWKRERHPATRVFQAIRIVVNRELEELEAVLPQCLQALAAGGRLVVISFHSLEDRIVKRFMREQERADPWPSEIPVAAAQIQPKLRRVGAAVKPGDEESAANPRARSAVLRVAERVLS